MITKKEFWVSDKIPGQQFITTDEAITAEREEFIKQFCNKRTLGFSYTELCGIKKFIIRYQFDLLEVLEN